MYVTFTTTSVTNPNFFPGADIFVKTDASALNKIEIRLLKPDGTFDDRKMSSLSHYQPIYETTLSIHCNSALEGSGYLGVYSSPFINGPKEVLCVPTKNGILTKLMGSHSDIGTPNENLALTWSYLHNFV